MKPSTPITNKNRLRELRLLKGLTQGHLGSLVGTSAQQIHKLEHAQRRMDVIWATKLARALGVQPSDVAGFTESPVLQEGASPYAQALTAPFSQDMVPFYGASLPTTDGDVLLPSEADSELPCPIPLQGVKGGYILTASGDTMSPRYKEGELLYVNPHRAPRPGQYVVVVRTGNLARIGELVRSTSTSVVIRQINPPTETTLPRHRITAIHSIVGSVEL